MKDRLKKMIPAIGGPERVRSLLKKFYLKMNEDVMIGFFFANHDLAHIAEQQANFILNAAGLAEHSFQGKGPATAHLALPPILSGHFDRRLILLKEVLTEEGLDVEWIQTWVDFEESFRNIVVKQA